MLGRADRLYEQGKYPAAAELYARLLPAAGGPDRRHCFERLLGIYTRSARLDRSIQTGLEYADWLARVGDRQRARSLDLELGEWYLSLGHYRKAETLLERFLRDVPAAPAPPVEKVRGCRILPAWLTGLPLMPIMRGADGP